MPRKRFPNGKLPSRFCVMLACLGFAACAATEPPAPNIAAAPPTPTDPVAVFAANAAPGQEASLVLASGESTRARLHRVYPAASGRECREVLLGSSERRQLVCQDPELGWIPARALLRGGARP